MCSAETDGPKAKAAGERSAIRREAALRGEDIEGLERADDAARAARKKAYGKGGGLGD